MIEYKISGASEAGKEKMGPESSQKDRALSMAGPTRQQ